MKLNEIIKLHLDKDTTFCKWGIDHKNVEILAYGIGFGAIALLAYFPHKHHTLAGYVCTFDPMNDKVNKYPLRLNPATATLDHEQILNIIKQNQMITNKKIDTEAITQAQKRFDKQFIGTITIGESDSHETYFVKKHGSRYIFYPREGNRICFTSMYQYHLINRINNEESFSVDIPAEEMKNIKAYCVAAKI